MTNSRIANGTKPAPEIALASSRLGGRSTESKRTMDTTWTVLHENAYPDSESYDYADCPGVFRMPDSPAHNDFSLLDAYWRASNYLTIGQIYLRDNPLLREPLRPEHIKPRLLGHWGTSPGQNFVYVHLNRLIKDHDASVIYISGPGHGGPAIVAQVYLEGTYSEFYPEVRQDVAGMRRLFRQFSTPGGIPSHAGPHIPGSIHEGGELGYSLLHAFGAAFDNPDLIVACVIGDGEAETGPLEGGWKGIKFLNPARDGAVLPILHLNGYKISGPTVLGRDADEDIRGLLSGHRRGCILNSPTRSNDATE